MSLLLAVLGLTTVGVGAANYILRHRLGQKAETLVEALCAAAEPSAPSTFKTSPRADLPAPIRRYLAHVLRDEWPHVQAVRIEQHGTFRSEGTASPWSAFTATQHVTTRPPGFVWDATIDLFPWVSVRVVDAYREGQGLLCAKLWGILTVANPEPSPDLDEGELMRYLAEAPLYPTALLPGMGVTWTPIDDQSARATLTHRGTTASLVFHVNDRDEVERVTGKRPFLKNDGTTERRPWKGTWHNYEEHRGLCVPTDGEVAWIHPQGEVSYWRGHIDTLDYRTGASPSDRRSSSPPLREVDL